MTPALRDFMKCPSYPRGQKIPAMANLTLAVPMTRAGSGSGEGGQGLYKGGNIASSLSLGHSGLPAQTYRNRSSQVWSGQLGLRNPEVPEAPQSSAAALGMRFLPGDTVPTPPCQKLGGCHSFLGEIPVAFEYRRKGTGGHVWMLGLFATQGRVSRS